MIIELIRMVAKSQADATVGVNAQIAALSLDSSVASVADTRPPNIVSIKNQADHNIVVGEGDGDQQYPLIVVCVQNAWRGPGQVWTSVQDFVGEIHVVYVTRGGSSAENFRDTDYSLRAMKKAAHAFLLAATTRDTNGKRNNVGILSSSDMEYGHAEGSFMGGQVSGVLKITIKARDQAP